MVPKECVNESFLEFVKKYNVAFHQTHARINRNMDAGFKSTSKYDRKQPVFDKNAFNLACDWLRQHFVPFVSHARVLDQQTVIDDMERSTSVGWPWSLKYHSKGEMIDANDISILNWYWEYIGECDYVHPTNIVDQQSYHPVWTSTQKDEIRTLMKIADNKNRTFTASPVEHTCAANRLCLDFNNMFYSAKESCSFVGRTKFFQGWQELYFKLGKFNLGFEFDASSWDASVFREALLDQMEFRWESFAMIDQTKINRRRLKNVYQEIINSVIIMESNTGTADIIVKNTGNPSGSANTIVDNTMVLYRVFAYCWIRLCDDPNLLNEGYKGYHDNVEMILNGDDNTMTVSARALTFFNAPNIIQMAKEVGIELTTPHMEPKPVMDLSFLSQTAVIDETFRVKWILPAPDYDRVLNSLVYGSLTNDIRWHLLRAAALHMDSWANLKLRCVLKDYMNYITRYYAKELFGTINDIKMSDIFASIRTDAWCYRLYTGLESEVCAVEDMPHKILTTMLQGKSLKRSFQDAFLNSQMLDIENIRLVDDFLFGGGVLKGVTDKDSYQRGMIHDLVKYTYGDNRERSGNPYDDGLIGVEPNPGPAKKNNATKIKKLKKKMEKKIVKEVKRDVFHPPPVHKMQFPNGKEEVKEYKAPVAMGNRTGRNTHKIMRFDGLIADCSTAGAITVAGSCFSNIGVGEHKSQSGDGNGLFLDGLAETALFLRNSFQDFDDRVLALAEVYQYYRIRRLTPHYVPLVGTTTTGQWSFGLGDNYNPITGTNPTTIKSLLTMDFAASGTPWLPSVIPTYVYNGAKVWSCPNYGINTTPNDYIQLFYVSRTLATTAAAADVEWGRMTFDYVMDFFEPRANQGEITVVPKTIVDHRLFRLFLSDNDRKQAREQYGNNEIKKIIVNMQKVIDDLIVTTNDYTSIQQDEPEFEENPMTKSLHVPHSMVQQLIAKLK